MLLRVSSSFSSAFMCGSYRRSLLPHAFQFEHHPANRESDFLCIDIVLILFVFVVLGIEKCPDLLEQHTQGGPLSSGFAVASRSTRRASSMDFTLVTIAASFIGR